MSTDHYCCDALVHPHWGSVPAPVTPREVLAETIHDAMGCEVSYAVCSGISKFCYDVAGALMGAGFEVLPTALVDAVLNLTPTRHDQADRYHYARDALAAYRRALVLLGQTEETQP